MRKDRFPRWFYIFTGFLFTITLVGLIALALVAVTPSSLYSQPVVLSTCPAGDVTCLQKTPHIELPPPYLWSNIFRYFSGRR